MQPKTVIVASAPWPFPRPKPPKPPKVVKEPKPKKAKHVLSGQHIDNSWYPKQTKPTPKLAISGDLLDIFAEAREQIASGAARGKYQQNGKNAKRK